MHATAWRRELYLYTSRRHGQPQQFRAKNPRGHVIMLINTYISAKNIPQSPTKRIILKEMLYHGYLGYRI